LSNNFILKIMKKLYILSLLIASTATFAQGSDAFPYTGALNANGWLTHSGISGQMTTLAGSLNYTGLTSSGNQTQIVAGNTEDVNLTSATALTGVAYYSALINLPNVTGQAANTTTGNYFLMLGTSSSTTPPTLTVFSSRLYIRAGSVADTFNLGILNGSGGTAAPTFSATDYSINTTYFVVVKFDFTSNTASLWVNPAIGSTEGTATVTNATGTTAAPAQVDKFAIREAGTATAGTGNILIDEVRIGGTWDYVTAAVLKNNQSEISGLSIYPNPVVNGTLFINTDANAERTVTVFDVLGKQILNTTTSTNAINVSQLNTGVYMVRITEEGKTATKKLVIR
jgi:hypothetical protein